MNAENLDLDQMIARDERRKQLLKIKRKILLSRMNLLDFTQYMRPDNKDQWDVDKSEYQIAKHHAFIAHKLEQLERGDIRRLIISVPPRHGKSELASKSFLPWYVGRNPRNSTIMATYNSIFAGDFGNSVNDTLKHPRFKQVFPGLSVSRAATHRVEIDDGGLMAFVGRGGSLTGRGGHLLMVDDPLKDRKEADSGLIRDQLWTWWTQVFATRAMVDDVRMLLIQTRWHEDDLVGRLTDSHNPCYNAREAKKWEVINLPALAAENDPVGRKSGEALWPDRFSVSFLAGVRDQDNRGFSALYQGEPAPDTGLFFGPEDIVEYQSMKEVPGDLKYYGASDHAVSVNQWADKTVLMVFGVDENDDIWIMPETNMNRHPSNIQVEIMLNLIKKYKPMFWFAERGHITKSIGPFLRKRMNEERIFTALYEMTPVQDKQSRAQSIKGRMAGQRVHFPAWSAWYQEARRQILTFPAGAKDDFVDTLSMVGLGMDLQVRGRSQPKKDAALVPGTFGHMLASSNQNRRVKLLRQNTEDW